MLYLLSTVVLILIAFGIFNRKNPQIHIPTMIIAFLLDLGIVLAIELDRGAVEQVVAGTGPLLTFHVTVSVLVLILYVILILSGLQYLKLRPQRHPWHKKAAYLFVVARLVNYVTSYYIGTL